MSGFVLKIIASISMLIDHTGAILPDMHWIFRCIGRIAFPVYAFLVAEGCAHTKNINKYMLRLGVFALISQIPFSLAFSSEINFISSTNIFYTLFLGVASVNVYKRFQQKCDIFWGMLPLAILIVVIAYLHSEVLGLSYSTKTQILLAAFVAYAACILVMGMLLKDVPEGGGTGLWRRPVALLYALPFIYLGYLMSTDYDMFGVALILLLYLAKKKWVQVAVLAAGIIYFYGRPFGALLETLLAGSIPVFLLFALMAVPLIFFYNKKRGPRLKWVFYCFYPAHLAVLVIIALFV